MSYRLIVSDMDDTLLGERGQLSPAVIEAVSAARKAGAELVLASGRMPCAMRAAAKALNVTLPMIAYNGAELVDPISDRIHARLHVSPELSIELIRYCEDINLHIQAYEGDEFLTPEDNAYARAYLNSLHGAARMRVTNQPLSRCVTWSQPKLLAITEPAKTPQLLEKIKERFSDRLICAVSRPQYIEFVSPEAGKERALDQLCRQLQISPEEVVVFGDGQNDIGMIRFAGLGCAMANARAEVRAQADLIAPSNREDGVAQIIMKLLKEGKLGKGA